MKRCLAELETADCEGNAEEAEGLQDRLSWIRAKQLLLDENGQMVIKDEESLDANGKLRPYGSMDSKVVRYLTRNEIRWNEQLRENTRAETANPPASSGAQAAGPRAATAPATRPPADTANLLASSRAPATRPPAEGMDSSPRAARAAT